MGKTFTCQNHQGRGK